MNTKVSEGSETAPSLFFSKQELSELADYLRFAQEHIKVYADETSYRHGRTFPMVGTLRAYAERAESLRRRVESSIT
jgi:hypothetical protein